MIQSKKIFVTGGTGFLGSYILRYLLKRGYTNIRALKRASSPMLLVEDIKDKIEWIEGDLMDLFLLEDVMQDTDQVYHAAAIVTAGKKEEALMKQINGEGTANVVNAANYCKIEKLLHVSSIAVLGKQKKVQKLSEKNHWLPSEYNNAYAISKYLGEQEVWRGMAEGLNAVIINPSVIIGSGIWGKGTTGLFDKVQQGLPVYPVGSTGFVDVRDVARMSIQLMESDISDQRVIANAVDMSYQDFFTTVANLLNKKPPGIKATPFLSGMAWRADWLRSKLTGSEHIVTKSRALLTSCSFSFDNALSKELLGFEYTPFEQTLEETAGQYLVGMKEGKEAGVLDLT